MSRSRTILVSRACISQPIRPSILIIHASAIRVDATYIHGGIMTSSCYHGKPEREHELTKTVPGTHVMYTRYGFAKGRARITVIRTRFRFRHTTSTACQVSFTRRAGVISLVIPLLQRSTPRKDRSSTDVSPVNRSYSLPLTMCCAISLQ